MTRRLMTAVLLTACCGAARAEPPAQKLYHLRKTPSFRVGGRAVTRDRDDDIIKVTAPDGAVVKESWRSRASHRVDEVLEVDGAGRIQAMRVTFVRATWRAGDKPDKPKGPVVAIEKVHFTARRKGRHFEADTTTVASAAARKLTASQTWLLKEYLKETVSFGGYPEPDVILLPAEPVRVGHAWKPTRPALDAWAEASPAAKRIQAKAVSAGFRLPSVREGVAAIEGTVTVRATLGGQKLAVPFRLSAKIDTNSGLWVAQTTSGKLSMVAGEALVTMDRRGEEAATFTSGGGKASAAPAGAFKIGWPRPGKDTNNHADKANGFSLNVPKGYKPRKAGLDEGILAAFANEAGSAITVGQGTGDRPMDADQYVRNFTVLMRRSVPDYAVAERKDPVLPGNVPAVLLRGTAQAGEVTLLTLSALDGPRVVTVSGTAQTHRKQDLAELGEALGSVRVFDPDLTQGP